LIENRTQLGQEAAKNIQRQTGGRWVVWYGRATGRLWAVCRAGYWPGLIEATSAIEMLTRIGEVDAWFIGPRRTMRRTASGAWAA